MIFHNHQNVFACFSLWLIVALFPLVRYTVAQENIPSFLEHLADKILRTGKYLNVVRECGVEVACPGVKGESTKDSNHQHAQNFINIIMSKETF